ncbi:hypothetical protein KGQ20_06390 [Catenulispora sp. NF23]|uniref:LigA n=1 Tax=Catenulispora pinistramenti TaxID=2705254 RepID=A0ABS5KHM5_9ACTN|nr:hypothetical protein [Catenulispora pinistramenti]MBS2532398.1 hypothetical protein [Catenulispora pinistramenti]MBS2545593.1 hypothetical protein [Catenulispora pinistramenti]
MTDLEIQEDDWARGVFDRVRTGQQEPHWVPDAVAAAGVSASRRTRLRLSGTLAAAAIVGISATAFTTLGGGSGGGAEAVSSASGDPSSTHANLTTYLTLSRTYSTGASRTHTQMYPAAAATTIDHILLGLDPTRARIQAEGGTGPFDVGTLPAGVHAVEIGGTGYWVPQGVTKPSLDGHGSDPSKPVGLVTIKLLDPQVGPDTPASTAPCGLGGGLFETSPDGAPKNWSPCEKQRQSDGSFIDTTHSLDAGAESMTVAARTFPNGSTVVIAAAPAIVYDHGEPVPMLSLPKGPDYTAGAALKPVPWTAAALAAALSGPDVKGLS